jgi:hypothetical protein
MTANASDTVERVATPRVGVRTTFWVLELAPFALALAVYLVAYFVMDPSPTGDEPHYLMAAQSLAYDGDVDLTNDYADRERSVAASGMFPLSTTGHAADFRDTGQLRLLRGVGMATLISPAVAIGGIAGAQLFMVLVAALLADQLFRLLRDLGLRRSYGLLGWAAVVLCYPLLLFSSQVYPEVPGALLLVVVLRIAVRWASVPLALALGSTAAGLLVWLQVRYALLSVGAFLGLVAAALHARRTPAAEPGAEPPSGALRRAAHGMTRHVQVARTEWRSVTLPLVLPYASLLGLLLLTTHYLFGTFNPMEPYARYYTNEIGTAGWPFLYEFALPGVLNPVHGWIPYVPVHWLGIAALGCLVLRWRWAALACLAVPVVYIVVIATAGIIPGFEFPGRYLVPIIPFVAIPIALALREVRAALVVFVPLFALSLVFALAAVAEPLHLYGTDDRSRVFGVRETADLYPVTNPWLFNSPTSFTVVPGEYGPTTGRVENGVVVARPEDGPGTLIFGPYSILRRADYRATVGLAASGAPPGSIVAVMEAVSGPPEDILARRELLAGELGSRIRPVTLEFTNSRGGTIETRVHYVGVGTVRSGPVRVSPVDEITVADPGRIPDWPTAVAWLLGTIGAGWLLVAAMKRSRRRAAVGEAG